MKTRFLFCVLFAAVGLFSQEHVDWSYNSALYEVNLRQYTSEGTFAAFREHLDRLQELGVSILWFMPIHPIGEKNRLGRLGSYYSVRDYLDVNPEFGTLEEFKELVEELHSRGFYVLIDWVGNHTAWDNVLTVEHPEWYVHDDLGRFIAPPGTNWSDVIELDYSQAELRRYMIDALKFWALEVGVDGFRCDAVDMMPRDFWAQAIAELKAAKQSLFFLAEVDSRDWHDVGFDMTYAWGWYGFGSGVLKRVADGKATAAEVNSYLLGEKSRFSGCYRLYFTANHDENSWQGTTRELFGDASTLFWVLSATVPGMPLIYSGQEAGLDKRLKFFDKDEIEWRDHPDAEIFRTLLQLKRRCRALWNGSEGGSYQRVYTDNDRKILAFLRSRDGDRLLVAANLTAETQTLSFKGETASGRWREVFSGDTLSVTAQTTVTLPAWGYRVYEGLTSDTGIKNGARPPSVEESWVRAFPNPFNSALVFQVGAANSAVIELFDVRGRRVKRLQTNGGAIFWDARNENGEHVAPGTYVYRVIHPGRRLQAKVVYLP
ncbi:MAG: alpha-amylase family glycosyl hydrolase [candidate division KSB1 bacterium]|nr:alpha-amylase family glycosyl hydrolase [candidate division KSB1 bacterium]MDZ7345630.1 alpha-amylase family glycosyl hydrolase [candidate division KSB1 bacterium]